MGQNVGPNHIEHLIGLGAPKQDFEELLRKLLKHACSVNRDSCRSFLSKHDHWLDGTD